MAITDFSWVKKLDVESVSGTPTISRTVPLKITSGDDSTTGTGEIVLDWTDIASEADIGIYDEDDNLLDYYFESFDATAEEAVIWVFRDWVQDGSTQLQVAYGSGPSDQSVSASTVFSKESDLAAAYLFNEDSGDLIDVSGNDRDGTVYGATQGETGIVGGAYAFDGDGDYVELPFISPTNLTYFAWIKTTQSDTGAVYYRNESGLWHHFSIGDSGSGDLRFTATDSSTTVDLDVTASLNDDMWHLINATYDGNTMRVFIDSIEEASDGGLSGDLSYDTNNIPTIGSRDASQKWFFGKIDIFYIYSTALSSDEITALYNATKSSPDFFSQQAAEAISIPVEFSSVTAQSQVEDLVVEHVVIPTVNPVDITVQTQIENLVIEQIIYSFVSLSESRITEILEGSSEIQEELIDESRIISTLRLDSLIRGS